MTSLPAPAETPDLLVIAGEASGDAHAAEMLREAWRQKPLLRVAALGGEKLRACCGEAEHGEFLFDLAAHAVVGFAEVARHYGFFRSLMTELVRWIAEHPPRAICLVDYPGFNLRLAKRLHKRALSRKGGGSIKLLSYISPQVWAWKAQRRFTMAQELDALACIFPFEPEFFADTELPVTFVGHPFAEPHYAPPVAFDPAGPALLLPGSRQAVVRRNFPVMLQALQRVNPGCEAILLAPDTAMANTAIAALPAKDPSLFEVRLMSELAEPIGASAALVSAGTMSLQVALAGIPGVIVYRAHPLTYRLGKQLVRVPFVGMANLILGREVWPELIQTAPVQVAAAFADTCRNAKPLIREAQTLAQTLRAPAKSSPAEWLLREIPPSW